MKVIINFSLLALGLIALALIIGSAGCAQRTVTDFQLPYTLCTLDFDQKRCWQEKSKNQGYFFGEMDLQNKRCGHGAPDYCWFAIGDSDLTRLLQRSEDLDEMRKVCKP